MRLPEWAVFSVILSFVMVFAGLLGWVLVTISRPAPDEVLGPGILIYKSGNQSHCQEIVWLQKETRSERYRCVQSDGFFDTPRHHVGTIKWPPGSKGHAR